MWWIKKKKKICKCPCHWSALAGTFNGPNVHCETCSEQIKEAKRLKKFSPTTKRKQLITELDDVTSLIVRIRAHWTCRKCNRRYEPVISKRTGLPAQNLMTCSHFFAKGSGGLGIRWDYDDLDALCIFCHQKVENHKYEWIEGFHYQQYMITKLGQERYNLLEYKANSTTIYSIFDLQIMLSQRNKELEPLLKQYE